MKKIKIIIKDKDGSYFGVCILGLVILWFTFVIFAPKSHHSREYVEWKSNESAMPSSGMEW